MSKSFLRVYYIYFLLTLVYTFRVNLPGVGLNTLYISQILLTGLIILKPKKLYRLIELGLLFVFLYFTFQLKSKIDHSFHIWPISMIGIALITNDEKWSKENLNLVNLSKSLVLCHYLSAGLWKLRGLSLFSLDELKNNVLDYISFFYAEGFELLPIVYDFIAKYPEVMGLLFGLVLIFQLSCFIPIVFQRFFFYYGVLLSAFHLTNGFMFDMFFIKTIMCLIPLFIIHEFMKPKPLSY